MELVLQHLSSDISERDKNLLLEILKNKSNRTLIERSIISRTKGQAFLINSFSYNAGTGGKQATLLIEMSFYPSGKKVEDKINLLT